MRLEKRKTSSNELEIYYSEKMISENMGLVYCIEQPSSLRRTQRVFFECEHLFVVGQEAQEIEWTAWKNHAGSSHLHIPVYRYIKVLLLEITCVYISSATNTPTDPHTPHSCSCLQGLLFHF